MCGICGILNYGNIRQNVEEPLLKRMSDAIAHRGPDDEGHFVSANKNCGFGFRRLAIVDLSPAGHQPMQSADRNCTLMLNGEIYNHLVLRKELEARGYRYRSRSDTETLLYAYQEYGLDFVHKLLGMFAIALWDERQQRLVLVRDRIGVKPLYYTFSNGRLIFGSEIKAILEHPGVVRELNEEALGPYLTFLIPPAPMTLFKNIYKLEPGTMMVVGADGTPKKTHYWDPVQTGDQQTIGLDGVPRSSSAYLDPSYPLDEQTTVETLRTMLRQSIKDRMMSDVPFGVFLSGGIDSSTNVALMAELMERPVDTFSVGFRDLEQYNELGYARQIARQFKTNHHEIIIDQSAAKDFLPKLIHHQDEPIADPVCIPLYFVSKLARDNGTIVVQVGEGSDEQFAGYGSMKRELAFYGSVWKTFTALPKFVQRAVYAAAKPVLERRQSYGVLDYIRKAVEGDELFWGGAIAFPESQRRALMNGRVTTRAAAAHEFARGWHESLLARDPAADYLKRMIYLEFRHRLPELLLMRVDKMSMATSVEARVPFLDHRIVEYSMRLPAKLKVHNGQTKYILKKAVQGIIPDTIIHRKKQGFALPVNEWLRKEWAGFTEHTLANASLVRNGTLNREPIERLWQAHRSGRRNAGPALWNLLNLFLWHQHWIEGRPH